MSRLIIALDSLRFYKLKNENTARILFLIVYMIFLGFYIFPIGKPLDIATVTKLLQGSAFKFTQISSLNIIYFIMQIVIYMVTSFLGLVYAASYIMEAEGFPNKKAIISSFRGLPKLIGFLLLMTIPIAISSILAFIPLIFLFYTLFFTPMLIIEGKRGIFSAITESFRATKGIKFSIFITQMTIYFLMNIPISMFHTSFLYAGYNDTIAEFLILAFLRAAYVLMGGRLAGNFYMLAVKNEEKLRKLKFDFSGTNGQDSGDANNETDSDNVDDKD